MLIQSLSYNTQKLKVGIFYQGGVIVYVDNNKRQGLIAYNTGYASDNLAWGPFGAYTQSSLYGQGFTNTQNAYNTLSPASNTALYTIWNGTFNGYSDWFIPNLVELNYVHGAKQYLPFWNCCYVWASEYIIGLGDAAVYAQNFDGTQSTLFRNETDNRKGIACRYITFT